MIEPNISGWQSIKQKLKQVIGVANKVENMTIQRGGTVDSVTFAGDSIKINVRDFPKAKAGGGGGGETVFPFQIVQIDADTIAIRKGTVSTIIPTIGGTPLDDDYTQNTIDATASTTFWLDATVNASEVITSVAIVTVDPGADTATQTKQILGSLTWASGAIDAISSNLGGSQNVDSCGASHSWNRI